MSKDQIIGIESEKSLLEAALRHVIKDGTSTELKKIIDETILKSRFKDMLSLEEIKYLL